ncbi:MAG TPA: hypothetical protein VJT82_06180, partial [Pyrinomonadaceae bacterium]|nr:hypothetical protein [Pyrinomonadaceae bacterium]
MTTSFLAKQATGLFLSLAILTNCFASSKYTTHLPLLTRASRPSHRDETYATPSSRHQWNNNSTLSPTSFVDPTPTPDNKITYTAEHDGNQEIYVMNPDGTSQTRLTNNTASDSDPAWSPDGTQ